MARKLLLITLLLLMTGGVGRAQDSYAAVMTVIYPGVEIRRANTEAWVELPLDAQAPFGVGDVLRTTKNGRAYLTFVDKAELLLLPKSNYELLDFGEADGLRLAARLMGQGLQRIQPNVHWNTYRLETTQAVMTQPGTLSAVWSKAESTIITVSQGQGEVKVGDKVLAIPENRAFTVRPPDASVVATLDSPLTAAHLEGKLYGCPGIVRTGGQNLNVRIGPGFSFTVIGNIENNLPIQIMGINEFGTWYRIQAFSGFAWIRKVLVKTDCENVPVLPRNTPEENLGILEVRQTELPLLEPFYGSPKGDLWFYRTLANAG